MYVLSTNGVIEKEGLNQNVLNEVTVVLEQTLCPREDYCSFNKIGCLQRNCSFGGIHKFDIYLLKTRLARLLSEENFSC